MTIKERLIRIHEKHPKLIPIVQCATDLFFALCGISGATMAMIAMLKENLHISILFLGQE